MGGRILRGGGWEVARPRGTEVKGGSSDRPVIGPGVAKNAMENIEAVNG